MPIVWIARLMGIPIKNRIAGSDIFEALKVRARPEGPLKVFLFGAKDSVAEAAARTLNAHDRAKLRRLDLSRLGERRRIESKRVY